MVESLTQEKPEFLFSLYQEKIRELPVDPENVPSLTLAYIGDCVYDLAVREYVLAHYPGNINQMNRRKTRLVCAGAQSEIMGYLIGKEGFLTEEEMTVYRHGRNHKSVSHSKNSSIQEYRRATGFEALIGYLYLRGSFQRLIQIEWEGIRHLEELAEKEEKNNR